MSRWESRDEALLGRLLAPPNLDDGVESLDYWRRRHRQLPWYRVQARREATRMMVCWEQRVGAAIVSQHRAPPEARLSAGVLVARSRLTRWTRRVGMAVLATVITVLVLVAVVVAAATIVLLHALRSEQPLAEHTRASPLPGRRASREPCLSRRAAVAAGHRPPP